LSCEKRITRNILRHLRASGGFWSKIHGGPTQTSGLPDIVGCHNGRFIALEVKHPGRGPTPRQELILEKLEQAGAVVGVVSSIDEAQPPSEESPPTSEEGPPTEPQDLTTKELSTEAKALGFSTREEIFKALGISSLTEWTEKATTSTPLREALETLKSHPPENQAELDL